MTCFRAAPIPPRQFPPPSSPPHRRVYSEYRPCTMCLFPFDRPCTSYTVCTPFCCRRLLHRPAAAPAAANTIAAALPLQHTTLLQYVCHQFHRCSRRVFINAMVACSIARPTPCCSCRCLHHRRCCRSLATVAAVYIDGASGRSCLMIRIAAFLYVAPLRIESFMSLMKISLSRSPASQCFPALPCYVCITIPHLPMTPSASCANLRPFWHCHPIVCLDATQRFSWCCHPTNSTSALYGFGAIAKSHCCLHYSVFMFDEPC